MEKFFNDSIIHWAQILFQKHIIVSLIKPTYSAISWKQTEANTQKFLSITIGCLSLVVPGDQGWITSNSEVYVGSPPACREAFIISKKICDKILNSSPTHWIIYVLLMFWLKSICEEKIIGGCEEPFKDTRVLFYSFRMKNLTNEVLSLKQSRQVICMDLVSFMRKFVMVLPDLPQWNSNYCCLHTE